MDVLFGDHKGPFPGRKSRATETHIMASVSPRILLPWSVIFSPTNKMVRCCRGVAGRICRGIPSRH
jgi:hypothetical protein